MNLKKTNPLFNQRGMIFIDVVYAFTLAFFLLFLFIIFAFCLSVIEVTQYITYAGARHYLASHHTPEDQNKLAFDKVTRLLESSVLNPFFKSNGWFQIERGSVRTGLRERFEGSDVGGRSQKKDIFIGLWLTFRAPILSFNIPFLGLTNLEHDGFTTEIRSFLGREITQKECQDFHRSRYEEIVRRFSFSNSIQNLPQSYGDNGC